MEDIPGLLKTVRCLTGFLNLSAKLSYSTNLQWTHQSLRVILFLLELTAKMQATQPNSYKIIISPFPDSVSQRGAPVSKGGVSGVMVA